jgi:hypothetical protein
LGEETAISKVGVVEQQKRELGRLGLEILVYRFDGFVPGVLSPLRVVVVKEPSEIGNVVFDLMDLHKSSCVLIL